jgi:hypothetical protein
MKALAFSSMGSVFSRSKISVEFLVPKMNGETVGWLRERPRPKCAPAENMVSMVFWVVDIGQWLLS